MSSHKADLLLHPVRLRIVTELINQPLTPSQLALALPDIAQATLYRQINLLLEGAIIEVETENRVNGAVERTYRLVQANLSVDDMRNVSQEEHKVYFNTFALSLMETFSRYIEQTPPDDIGSDGMSYNRAVLYLNDDERQQFQKAIMEIMMKFMSKSNTVDRKRFTLASIVIPDEREKNE